MPGQDPFAIVSEEPIQAPQASSQTAPQQAPQATTSANDPYAIVSEEPIAAPKPVAGATAVIDPIDKLAAQFPLADRINKGLKEGVEAGFGLHDIDANDHPYSQMLSQTWDNLKSAAKQSYLRMGGQSPNPIQKVESAAATPIDMLASGVEGMASLIEGGSKELITGAKNKDPQAIARGFAKMMSGVGQAAAGSDVGNEVVPKTVDAAANVAKSVAEKAKSTVQESQTSKAAKVSSQDIVDANRQFKQAIPSTKSTPYEEHDMDVARNYLEPSHAARPIQGVEHTVDALDHSIEGIENKVSEHVGIIPHEPIATDVLHDVQTSLEKNQRGSEFVNSGMKEIEGLNLDNVDMTRADAVRRQLNLENKAILKKNNYDLAAARAADPGFAAREAAAESLRNGIYKQLEKHGIEGVRQLRLEEGSLIKVRNAAQNQVFNGEKTVRGSGQNSVARQIGRAGITGASSAAGGAVGSVLGPAGTGAGALAGGLIGKDLAERVIPTQDFTRDELIQNSLGKKIATGQPGGITVNLHAPPGDAIPAGTQGELQIPDTAKGVPEQPDLFGNIAPYPSPTAALQSPQNQLLFLQKEIRPLKAILDDPGATSAQKVEAAQKLAALPLSDLQNVSAESNPSGGRPESLSPEKRTPEAKSEAAPKAKKTESEKAEKEVMVQSPKTSRATPTGNGGTLPPEIKAYLERQAGRKLSDEDALSLDRANLERGMAEAEPGDTNKIREEHREKLEKPDKDRYKKKIPEKHEAQTDNMSDPDVRYNAAKHEAGHAVVSELLNPGSVTDTAITSSGGATNIAPPTGKTDINQLTSDEVKNILATSLAGGLSEEGGTTTKHASGDLALRSKVLGSKASSAGQNISRVLSGKTFGEDEMLHANNALAEGRAKVQALLADPKNRKAIDDLAEKLTVRGKLSGSQVREFLNNGRTSVLSK